MLLKLLALTSVAALLGTMPCAATTLFVAANGAPANIDCTALAPCNNILQAVTKAAVGDTVVCLSAPAFGQGFSITKSITIDCTAGRGLVRDSTYGIPSTNITINIPPSSSDALRTVRLRGLIIDGANIIVNPPNPNTTPGRGTAIGIDIQAAAVVHIEDCVISNVIKQGIYDHRTGGQTKLFVKDSIISGVSGPAILAASLAVGITVLDNVRLEDNKYGLAAASGNNVVINRSVMSGNSTAGVEADSGAKVNVSNSVISHNNIGVQAFGSIMLRENEIEFSNTAIQGATLSFGANRISRNGANGTIPSPITGAPADMFY